MGPVDFNCPNCQAKEGQPCTQPTNTGRRDIKTFHLARGLRPPTRSEDAVRALNVALEAGWTLACECGAFRASLKAEIPRLLDHALNGHPAARSIYMRRDMELATAQDLLDAFSM